MLDERKAGCCAACGKKLFCPAFLYQNPRWGAFESPGAHIDQRGNLVFYYELAGAKRPGCIPVARHGAARHKQGFTRGLQMLFVFCKLITN